MKFGTIVRIKPYNDRGEFELDRARSKNNIAEKSVAREHETHNKCGCSIVVLMSVSQSVRPSVYVSLCHTSLSAFLVLETVFIINLCENGFGYNISAKFDNE